MPRTPQAAARGESPRYAVAIRVYADLPDGGLYIQDVPAGELTTVYTDRALAIGTNVRVCALGAAGQTLDRVRVR